MFRMWQVLCKKGISCFTKGFTQERNHLNAQNVASASHAEKHL
ncbi:unnamed protein product [Staurois parvus]|uniref:Uncharacterized protein n=1 Tax=Staurois parvus TaxID=386267 RepID=A0ABN9FX94_9NEOB|nr:unnamed protein product [Staurois parvus]